MKGKILLKDDPQKKKNYPTLSLMKISRYFKENGWKVGFDFEDPDRVYQALIFSPDGNDNHDLREYNGKTIIGGSGYDIDSELPEEIEFIKPDYDLYPDCDYSLGFSTRGCIRNCGFCIVRQKEGYLKRWQHPKHFHDERFNKIRLLDNNILADREWFFEVTKWILDNNLKVDFNQGLDIRLLDDRVMKRLTKLDLWGNLNFAWDFMETEKKVIKGIKLLKEYDFNLRSNIGFYVLTNFNTSHKEDLYRCKKLKSLGTNAYVMRYNMRGDYFTDKLARWCNARWIYWSCDFIDYEDNTERIREEIRNMEVEG